jgi:hypothetical protein
MFAETLDNFQHSTRLTLESRSCKITNKKMAVFWVVAPCSLVEVYHVSEVIAVSIRAMMEATSTSETSVNFYKTVPRNNPEDSHLHTRRRENLKSRLQTT